MSLSHIFRLLALVFSVILIGVIGIIMIRRSAGPSPFSFTGSRGGEWKLELYKVEIAGNSGDMTISSEANKTSGELHFSPNNSTVSTSDLFKFNATGSSNKGITLAGTYDVLISISGQIEGNRLNFTPTLEGKTCDATATGMGITTKSDCAYFFSSGSTTTQAGTIELNNSAQATTTQEINQGTTRSLATYRWRITKLSTPSSPTSSCQDIPQVKTDVERILESSIIANETPQQIHDKLMALSNEKYPINNRFKKDEICFKIAGASIDLQYKIDGSQDSIIRTNGETGGRQDHHLVTATIDKTAIRDSREVQVYYQATIDVALDR